MPVDQAMIRRSSLCCTAGLVVWGFVVCCLNGSDEAPAPKNSGATRPAVDNAAASAAGIRKLPGRRLTLYTDMRGTEIDVLPEVFGQEFPQLCGYFEVSPERLGAWGMTGFLMKEKALFVRSGLLPGDLPAFPHGFSRNHELWIYDQPSDYYRRHLLLHEGVHGFMNTVLGGCGPTWYMEGMAEMLATHQWRAGRLTLNYFPKNRDEVPEWGRIRLIKDAMSDNRALMLRTVIEGPRGLEKETELYAWCWVAAYFLDHNPQSQGRFRGLYKHVRQRDFNQHVFEVFKNDWAELSDQWQVFIAGLEYGYDISRTMIDFTPGRPLPEKGAVVTIAADRGWQNAGIQLQAGSRYRIAASGRYQVANRPKIWWCEPGGVSIRYYQGRPLGILLGAVRPEKAPGSQPLPGGDANQPAPSEPATRKQGGQAGNPEGLSPFIRPIAVGLETVIVPEQSGTLFLKVNDSAAELDDNAGELRVEVTRIKE